MTTTGSLPRSAFIMISRCSSPSAVMLITWPTSSSLTWAILSGGALLAPRSGRTRWGSSTCAGRRPQEKEAGERELEVGSAAGCRRGGGGEAEQVRASASLAWGFVVAMESSGSWSLGDIDGLLDFLAVVSGTRDKGCYAAKELLGGGFSGAVGGSGRPQDVECGTRWSLDRWTARKSTEGVSGHPPHVPDEP